MESCSTKLAQPGLIVPITEQLERKSLCLHGKLFDHLMMKLSDVTSLLQEHLFEADF